MKLPKPNKHRTYETGLADSDFFNWTIEYFQRPDLASKGHVVVEMSDGDVTGVWYSTDPEPSKTSDYEVIHL